MVSQHAQYPVKSEGNARSLVERISAGIPVLLVIWYGHATTNVSFSGDRPRLVRIGQVAMLLTGVFLRKQAK